jgi:hypothetical protein
MANKKVNQLTTKPAVNSTDLFLIADPTSGQAFKSTISSLGAAIGSAVASVNGLVGVVVLDTDDIQELSSPTNKWFTDTRARAALSAGTGITYNSGTGVITNAVTSGQISTALGYTPANDSLVVKLSGNQTISGNLTATSFIKSGGLSTEFLMADGSVSTGASFTYPQAGIVVSTGTGWGTSITNNSTDWNTAYSSRISSLTTNNSSGSATLLSNVLNIPTYTLAGLGGQPAFVSGTGFVKISGTTISYVNETYLTTAAASSTYLTIANAGAQYQPLGSYVSGSGSSTRLARWISSTDLSVSVIYDDGTNIGIGQAPGAFKLDVTGTARITGAATFSSSITTNATNTFSNANSISAIFSNSGAEANFNTIELRGGTVGSTVNWQISKDNSTANALELAPSTTAGGTTYGSTIFRITSAGAATFSGSITGTSFIKTGGSSTEFLKANGSVDSNTYLTTSVASSTYLSITSAAAQYQPIGSYVSGSGSSSRLARWISSSDLSVAQIWDDGTNVGIGQAPGAFKLDVTGTLRVTGATSFSSSVTGNSFVKSGGSSSEFLKADGSVDANTYLTTTSAASQYQPIGTYAGGSGESGRLARWTSSSNLSVAQIWDNGTNIGIGQAAGSYKLDVTGTFRVVTPNRSFFITSNAYSVSDGTLSSGFGMDGDGMYLGNVTSSSGWTISNPQVTIRSSGNVGIGMTPFANTIAKSLDMVAGAGMFGYADQNYLTGNLYFDGGWKAKAAGNGSIINLAASINFFTTTTGTAGGAVSLVSAMTIASSGAITCGFSVTASSFFESSDKTIKTLIEDNYQAKGIESVTAKYYLKNGVKELGYFAQDVQAILPSAVSKGENGLLNLSYREVHTAKIARLEKEIEELKAKLN